MNFKALDRGELLAMRRGDPARALAVPELVLAGQPQRRCWAPATGPNTSLHRLGVAVDHPLPAADRRGRAGDPGLHHHPRPRAVLAARRADRRHRAGGADADPVPGLIDKPGTPRGEISIAIGWWVALVADLLILAGSVWRAQESGAARKPPGVL